jgi:uncharacterized protein GlcG (DUF336 family)
MGEWTMKQIIIALAALSLAIPAAAQTSEPVSAPNLELAQKAAKAAFKACKGTPIAVAVLDSNAQTRLLLLGDGVNARMGGFAIRKAATALRYHKPSAETRDEAKTNPALAAEIKADPALIPFGGGLLFSKGAVAVAGAPKQEMDIRCAEAAKAVLEK